MNSNHIVIGAISYKKLEKGNKKRKKEREGIYECENK